MSCEINCQNDLWSHAKELAGGCTVIVWMISLYQMYKHLRHLTNSHFQNRILAILFMAPFYSLTSFLTIYYGDIKGYFGLLRDIYESVLIYSFFYLLSMYVAYDDETKEIDYQKIYKALATKGIRPQPFPMNYITEPLILISETRGAWFYRKARLFILQYLAVKPLVTFCLIIVYMIDVESSFVTFFKGIVFVSVMYSVYYLVLFYQLLKEELAFAKPLMKFIAVKGVLFFTFWQDLVIEVILENYILSYFTFPENTPQSYKLFILTVLENLFVCVEMIILAALLVVAFSHRDFKESQKRGFFFGKDQAKVLTKRLLNDVITTNFVNALGDLKELKEPLKDPFKYYDQGRAKFTATDMMSVSAKLDKGLLTKEDLDEFRVNVEEKPAVIPNFIDHKYSTVMYEEEL